MKEENKYQTKRDPSNHLDEIEFAIYADFLRGDRKDVPGDLEAHVGNCAYCRHELMAITDLLDRVDWVEDSGSNAGKEPRHLRGLKSFMPLLRIAAALAVLIVVSGIIQQFIIRPGRVNVPDSVRYAGDFLPNPSLEAIVSAEYRSAKDPLVQGPSRETVFAPGDTLVLTWSPDTTDRYLIVIMDNQAGEVQSIRPGGDSVLVWKVNVKPGLYYWRFHGREDLWKIGKFRVIGRK